MAKDPYKYFRIEANEIVDSLSHLFAQLREKPADTESIREILRLAHTLKGAANVVKQPDIASTAHSIEDSIAPYSSGEAHQLSAELARALMQSVEVIAEKVGQLRPPPEAEPEQEVASVPEQTQPTPVAATPHVTEVTSVAPSRASSVTDDIYRTVRVELDEMDQLLNGLNQATLRLNGMRLAVEDVHASVASVNAILNQLSRARRTDADHDAQSRIMRLVEDLSTLLAGAEHHATHALDQVDRELAGVREYAEQLRLVRVRALVPALERAVLNAADMLHRKVRFMVAGSDLRIDAELLAAVRDGLFHVVRNAVAHGIETPEERLLLGKPALGTIHFEVQRRGRRIAFICEDDGAGVNLDSLRAAAIERGFLSSEEASAIDREGLLRILLRPGLTTSKEATLISGRGIGLDVIAQAVERLNGSIDIQTETRRGTRVEIVVPASVVSIPVLLVDAGSAVISIPSEAGLTAVRLDASQIVQTPAGPRIFIDHGAIPFLDLAAVLGIRASTNHGNAPLVPSQTALLIRFGESAVAVGVRRIVGTGTVVMRALPPFLRVTDIVAGASLDIDGNPQLVLDTAALLRLGNSARAAAPINQKASPLPILVIDDSLTTRMLEESILEAAGYQVDVAVSAEEALDKARAQRFGLFLVDVEMPGMNGFEFIEVTRKDSELSQVPAILVTSRSANEDRNRGIEVGASDYVVKSEFNQQNLLDRIAELVRVE